MNHRILITGSSGLVGTALASVLLAKGADVVCFDLRALGEARGDVRDRDRLHEVIAGVDGIVHLAAVSRVIWGERDPDLCWATNVGGLRNVLEMAAESTRTPWVIFASSREVYGQPDLFPVTEDCPLRPVNVYGRSKVEGERLVAEARRGGVRACTIRLSNVFGSTADHVDRVVPAFARAAALGQGLRVDGLDHTFDFTHIDDVTRGVVTLVELLAAGDPPPPPVHFVSGRSTTLGELASLAVRLGQSGAMIRAAAPRDFDVARFVGTPARAKALLGWQPLVRLEDGVARLIDEFREAPSSRRAGDRAMKILKVIHGYPMRYNAGSEVYSQTLCHGLAVRHEVHVFTREEDAFAPDFRLRSERDADDPRIAVHVVNNPRLKDRYCATGIDQRFAEVLDRVAADVVHVGHLNHLSTSLLREAALREVPIVFTLHDYWLMCPRGQFMQMFPEDPSNLWAACDGQEDRKCAERCYARYFSGAPNEQEPDIGYWTGWVARRMRHVREMAELVDLFIAPARYIHDRFRDEFGLPQRKLVYLDYGFARERMIGRRRVAGEPFTFGYIGTHIPAKGIHDLIRAFGAFRGEARLRIWGRPRGQDTEALQRIAALLPADAASRVEWLPEYKNQAIVRDVFDRCDAIVVPSVWVENSPLVIHEAQQARVPVVTAKVGGMAEYVHHEVNGLLFEHRSVAALAEQMQRLVDDPALAARLGARGYPFSDSGDIPSVEQHVRDVEEIYQRVLHRRVSARVRRQPGPWRITFDTNPDTCNLRCIMCEEHSSHSPLQIRCTQDGKRRRLMPFAMIERVIAEAVPHGLREVIPSTMGEPLLYEYFEGILDLCRRYNVKLNLTTNGTFPRLGATAWAARIVPVASDVKISWNGATKATHEAIMLGSPWEKVVQNVRDFIAVRDAHAGAGGNRCRITFQLTFLEANVAELADMVRLAIDLGVDRVKGHHVWAHFDQIREQSMRRSPAAIERWNRAVLAAREAAAERTLPNGKNVLLDNLFLLDSAAMEDLAPGGPCPFLGQEAWVSAVGRFDPCCAPDAQRRTLGEFGNLTEQGFMEIWNGEAYRELASTYRNRSLCLSCNMRRPAGGAA